MRGRGRGGKVRPKYLPRATREVKFPTAAYAVLEFDNDKWSELKERTARLVHLTRPRDLDPDLGPETV